MEAVCLKAMARIPAGRYATPKDLADDLERWLADEPVSARPDPVAARVWRWAKRHRTAVAGLAVALVMATFGMAWRAARDRGSHNASAWLVVRQLFRRRKLCLQALAEQHTFRKLSKFHSTRSG